MMRSLLESSWMKFGPAERDSLDLSAEPSALPSTDSEGQRSANAASIAYIAIATVSSVLILLSVFSLWRRRRSIGGKMGVANLIALEDLQNFQDPERSGELLSSLRGGRGQQRKLSSGSEHDDGVFLMVYLPSPYEHTLTRIARAASTSSSKDSLPPSTPGPETGARCADQ